jgi:succinate dehydrogenase assembly factor 2
VDKTTALLTWSADQSRKRGILESDLLLSTFADAYLPTMTREQMMAYDRFLDENDWDIYYWATQEPPTSSATASDIPASDIPSSSSMSSSSSSPSSSSSASDTSDASYAGGAEVSAALDSTKSSSSTTLPPPQQQPGESGEWAQTVGRFKPAYRPVPARWRDSEVLTLLREHVRSRSGEAGGGMGFMPGLRH